MDLQDILYEKPTPSIALATFHRPKKLNAFRNQTFQELLSILDDFEQDSSSRVLILTGSGRAFSSGADLSEVKQQLEAAMDTDQYRKNLDNINFF